MPPTRYDNAKLKRDAEAQGLTGAGLARRAHVSQTAVSRFFRGLPITPPILKKLADALEQPAERYIPEVHS